MNMNPTHKFVHYVHYVLLTLGLSFVFTACGTDHSDKKKKTTSHDSDLVVSGDTVSFDVMPPEDDDNDGYGLAATSDSQDDEAEPSTGSVPQSDRIRLVCKGLVYPTDAVTDLKEKETPAVAASSYFEFGLEQTFGDAIGYEHIRIPYDCGKSGATVTISSLSKSALYRIDADFYNRAGVHTHRGATKQFSLGQDGYANVKLVMKRLGENTGSGKADVDIIFQDGNGGSGGQCRNDVVCTMNYAPVICKAKAITSKGVAVDIGPVNGGNRCLANGILAQKACFLDAKITEVNCEELEIIKD